MQIVERRDFVERYLAASDFRFAFGAQRFSGRWTHSFSGGALAPEVRAAELSASSPASLPSPLPRHRPPASIPSPHSDHRQTQSNTAPSHRSIQIYFQSAQRQPKPRLCQLLAEVLWQCGNLLQRFHTLPVHCVHNLLDAIARRTRLGHERGKFSRSMPSNSDGLDLPGEDLPGYPITIDYSVLTVITACLLTPLRNM